MANTYSQIYIHVVFAVKGRQNLINPIWKEKLHQYISGIVSNQNQKLMIVNSVPDHIHLLLGIKPDCILSDLMRIVKSHSTKWILDNQFVRGKFEWQTGFGAFSVSQSGVPNVIKYIQAQEEHHRKKTFREEYISMLKAYEVDFKLDYIFEEAG